MDENCYVEPIFKDIPSEDQLQNAEQITLAVSGMGCQNCVTRVRNSLVSLEGVYDVDVYLNMGAAIVIFDKTKILAKELIDAVARAGNDGRHEYRAELIPKSEKI